MPYDNVPELPDFDIEFEEIDVQDMLADEFATMGVEAVLDPDEDEDEDDDPEPYEDNDFFNPDDDNEDEWN